MRNKDAYRLKKKKRKKEGGKEGVREGGASSGSELCERLHGDEYVHLPAAHPQPDPADALENKLLSTSSGRRANPESSLNPFSAALGSRLPADSEQGGYK